MKYKIILAASLAAIFHITNAQSNLENPLTPNKLFIRYGLSGAFIDTKNSRASFGGGSELSLGWYFTRQFAVYLTSKGYHMDKASFADSDPTTYFRWGVNGIGVKYSFVNRERNQLYLDGAYLQSSIRPDISEKVILSGNGFSAGAGLKHFVAPQWAISAEVHYVYSKFRKRVEDDNTVDFDLHGHGVNISAGFGWHPFANRDKE